jgi:hypothetical protein
MPVIARYLSGKQKEEDGIILSFSFFLFVKVRAHPLMGWLGMRYMLSAKKNDTYK